MSSAGDFVRKCVLNLLNGKTEKIVIAFDSDEAAKKFHEKVKSELEAILNKETFGRASELHDKPFIENPM